MGVQIEEIRRAVRATDSAGTLVRETQVGEGRWRVYPAREALHAATAAIRQYPEITRCAAPACQLCEDAILGGPILPDDRQ
jgi:hypothetical protein